MSYDFNYALKGICMNIFRTVVIATGMHTPNSPHIEGDEYIEEYETVSVNPDDFEGQTVLILGMLHSEPKRLTGLINKR